MSTTGKDFVCILAVSNNAIVVDSLDFTISFLNDSTAAPVCLCCCEFSIKSIGSQVMAHAHSSTSFPVFGLTPLT